MNTLNALNVTDARGSVLMDKRPFGYKALCRECQSVSTGYVDLTFNKMTMI